MSHDPKIAAGTVFGKDIANTISSDIDSVTQQLAVLRADIASLSETMSGIAGRRGSDIASDISEGLDEARQYAKSTSRSAEQQIETSVSEHPFWALGLAAGAGLLIGAMSRR